ncbi:hypothetical protein JRQ81_001942 [Phrynocephalus forsythii]|uniref:Taste receptor type 2 n=1 Tax=Phrynocephalus forsythii TaxID=171643 RepID=A0A9Q1B914_9SAUR|nr:hypothetical protein JRQ81_001942 [Phrynocephalus forsythii]
MATPSCNFSNPDKFLLPFLFHLFMLMETVVGMLLSAFIVLVTCVDGIRKRHLKSIDKILTALGISRYSFLFVLTVKMFVEDAIPWTFDSQLVYQTFKAAAWFLTSTNLCFSACLCLFYCVKVANFQHYLFVSLKTGISRLTPWLLLLSVAGSLVNTSPFFLNIYTSAGNPRYNNSFDSLENDTSEIISVETNLENLFFFCGTGFSLVFAVLTTSALLLLFSLGRHSQRMRNSSNDFSNPNMAAHFQAVKTILFLLINEVINFVALMLLLSNIFPLCPLGEQVYNLILFACPSIQSVILIRGNTKLQETFMRVTHCIRSMSFFIKR